MDRNTQASLFTDNENLVPCIECGGDAELIPSPFGGKTNAVICKACGAWSKYSYTSKARTISMWNMNNHPDRKLG